MSAVLREPHTLSVFPELAGGTGPRVADALVRLLELVGVEHVFGVIGGACAPLADAVARSRLRFLHTRHEVGAAFAATEASLATGRPAAVLTTTGPGLLNALNGLAAARWDGAKVVCLSAATAPAHQGRLPVQETSRLTFSHDAFFSPGPLFDHATLLTDSAELVELGRRLRSGLLRPQGFVAHVGVSTALQSQSYAWVEPSSELAVLGPGLASADLDEVCSLLTEEPICLWLGYGSRHAARELRALAERLGAFVMSTPRAKGIFPESHPLYLGVTGAGGHESPALHVQRARPRRTLVLGSRLGEASSFWEPRLVPEGGFVHVDVDRAAFAAAYPRAKTVGIQAEIGGFVRALLRRLERAPIRVALSSTACGGVRFPERLEPRARAGVRPAVLMQAVQRVVVEDSRATVLAESGNAFGFGNHHLRFSEPGRYRSSAAWGSMGHMACGVLGVAVATGRKAVALVGDGAMLMNNELSTAVQAGAKAVWIVLNDGGYGIVRDGMRLVGLEPVAASIPRVDFVAFARAQGADGVRVNDELALPAALAAALQSERPFLIDVEMAEGTVSPALAGRASSLKAQYDA